MYWLISTKIFLAFAYYLVYRIDMYIMNRINYNMLISFPTYQVSDILDTQKKHFSIHVVNSSSLDSKLFKYMMWQYGPLIKALGNPIAMKHRMNISIHTDTKMEKSLNEDLFNLAISIKYLLDNCRDMKWESDDEKIVIPKVFNHSSKHRFVVVGNIVI